MPAAPGVRSSRNPPKPAEILRPDPVLIGLDIEIVIDINSWEARVRAGPPQATLFGPPYLFVTKLKKYTGITNTID
ncbi:jg25011 [Pararge aegeria aegeria]|uniref:Jg25011 protein n=1 Tax=Pararge aegeria aegeria TaxID=348720 RepID=A0A8S4QHP3_9NEOP|nr:jg25011 [Pararge aegeria aegeria]